MPQKWKTGDVVRLRSGGPTMTVVQQLADEDTWQVAWFTSGDQSEMRLTQVFGDMVERAVAKD